VLGWTPEEIMRIPVANLIRPEDYEHTQAASASMLSGGELIDFENRFRHKDGSYL